MGTAKSKSAHVLKGLFLRIYLYSSLFKNYVILQIMLLILIILSNERPHNFNTKRWYGSIRSQSKDWVCPGTGWTGFQSLFYDYYGDGSLAINTVALCDYVSPSIKLKFESYFSCKFWTYKLSQWKLFYIILEGHFLTQLWLQNCFVKVKAMDKAQ